MGGGADQSPTILAAATRTLPTISAVHDDGRLSAPAAERNAGPLGAAIGRLFAERTGVVLEIGSGTGQHVADWAARLPQITWQPSDLEGAHLESIGAWVRASGRANVRPPIVLDARLPWPDLGALTGVVAVNVIHISPWAVTEAIADQASRHLDTGGRLVFYGPFSENGRHSSESNAAFDASLRARDPEWGVRDRAELTDLLAAHGFAPPETTLMPANNLTLAFERL